MTDTRILPPSVLAEIRQRAGKVRPAMSQVAIDRERLLEHIDIATEVLRECEFAGGDSEFCPICLENAHAPDCKLAALLAATPAGTE